MELPSLPGTVPTRVSRWIGWLLVASALLIMLTILIKRGQRLAYDEPWHRMTVYALKEQGASVEFLRGTKYSAPGPLFALTQAAAEPVTGLRAPGTRLVSVVLTCILAGCLAAILRRRGIPDALGTVLGGLLAAPFGWAAYGMAITEPPAMCAAGIGLLFLALACSQEDRVIGDGHNAGIGLAVAGGFFLGVAVCGRQLYIGLLPCLIFLAGIRGQHWRLALAAMIAMAVLPAGLFLVWGGLTAPQMRWNADGFRLQNFILGPAFTGFAVLVLAPGFFASLRKQRAGWGGVAALVTVIVTINTLGGFYARKLPMYVVRGNPLRIVENMYGGLVLAVAVLFFVALAMRAWEKREDRTYLFWCAAAALLVLAPGKIPFGFDVRWLVSALPFVVLVTAPDAPATYWRSARWSMGMAVSAILFSGYLHSEYAGDGSKTPPEPREMVLSTAHQ